MHCKFKRKFDLSAVGGDPVQEVGHLGVDTWVVGKSASNAPGNDAVLDGVGTSSGEERAAGITLAGVDATCKVIFIVNAAVT